MSTQAYVPVRKVPGQPGKYYNRDGYVLVWVARGRFELEHRVIVAETLGRELKPDEVVHHINGVRSDNRKTNLLVCSKLYHEQLHLRCLRRFNRWHLPGIPDPERESRKRLAAGEVLSAPNTVLRMKPPWEYKGSDTVTLPTGSRKESALLDQSVASILRELGKKR